MVRIQRRKILAVEGDDEINFFDALFRYLSIPDVEIYQVGGKDQFRNKLPALVRTTGFFTNVEAFAVIRDANHDAKAAFNSVKDVLKKQNLNPPDQINKFSESYPRIGIFIMPGCSDEGMLEDLCLSTVRDHPIMKCVDDYIDCISREGDSPKNLAKAKTQAFLAAMPKAARSVGLGAQMGYWNFESEVLAELKKFIENFR